MHFPDWMSKIAPILGLLVVVAIVLARLPKVELGHDRAFLRRRLLNWLPLGLTYAFLYMGRYNLTAAKNALGGQITNEDFGQIFAVGTLVYGCSFVFNGPLADKLGGRATILISAAGAAVCNAAMGLVLTAGATGHLVATYTVLYALNMYFQSFGAVSIVKVNAHWFHVRERGTFGGIFGILISLGLYFAFDWSAAIITTFGVPWAFYVPALILVVFFVLDWIFVYDWPSQVGLRDIDTAEASLSQEGEKLSAFVVARRMFSNPILVTIALIEFCSGYFRQAVMQWGPLFAKQTGAKSQFVHANWGLMLCIAGITGGVVAGSVSDHVFQSRRGPSAVLLYGVMLACAIASCFLISSPLLGWFLVAMSMCIIGVHGLLSASASMDFAGKRNTGLAVGIIDGFVYLGTALQAFVLGHVLPNDQTPEMRAVAAIPSNWSAWPVLIVPAALVGLALSTRLWNAKPKSGSAAH